MIRVFLAGEGRSELGSRAGHPTYQSDQEPGVVETLLRAVRSDGWEVVGAIGWKDIPKLRVNAPDDGDARSVQAASMHAAEAGADVLAFVRDRDRDPRREANIETAIDEAAKAHPVKLVGGVAIECIEGWLLALAGETKSEQVRHPENEMGRLGLDAKRAAGYVAHIEEHGLAKVPDDAVSLRRWLEHARGALDSELDHPST
jgi:hypothetical protein